MSESLVNAKTYFAVQIEKYENAHEVVQLVMTTADKLDVRFQRLESMDVTTVGPTGFLRFRTDASDVTPVLDALAAQGRGIIRLEGTQYIVRKGARSGSFMASRMLSVACRTDQQRVYLGTAVKHWANQFNPA